MKLELSAACASMMVRLPALRQVATQVGSAANSNMGGAATTSQCEKPVCEVRSPAAFL